MKWVSLKRLLAVVFLLGGQAWAADGVVTFASGDVQILRDGQQIAVQNGTEVNAGDQVVTKADGRVRWRMNDDSFFALRPDSQLHIEAFRMPQADEPPATGKVTLKLMVGVLRTVTGLIGKRNPEGWALNTPTATMGIRGSVLLVQVNKKGSTQAMFLFGQGFINTLPVTKRVAMPTGSAFGVSRNRTNVLSVQPANPQRLLQFELDKTFSTIDPLPRSGLTPTNNVQPLSPVTGNPVVPGVRIEPNSRR